MSKIGFIGLGIMGRPMAGHLADAGHEILTVVHNTPVPDELARKGVSVCDSPQAVAEQAEIVITMVPDTPDVETVLFGDNGVAGGIGEGKMVIDMSSISPIATKSFAERINALGAEYVDAPVSGGEAGAKNAALTIMVGATEAGFERARPLFDIMGKTVTHIGGNGD
ncbi:MAG TPA: NAD(P)-dependent oxidoreductase, partial [Gammaproteobacteria bacterium]|nr:NAD(P)-dependent oxidoreductase [Gammaproteobacteria bacterium]